MHPSVRAILKHFKYDHLKPPLRVVSKPFCELAYAMVEDMGLDGPELTAGLRKLLEAKDCAVRAALDNEIPGLSVQHAIITNACRTGRGDEEAFEEAVRRMRAMYKKSVEGWGERPVNFHLVLTVERK